MPTSIYHQRFIERRKAAGVCVLCGKPLDREGIHCKTCREKINQNTYLDRHFYQDRGICPRCRKNTIIGDEKQCLECNAKAYANMIRTRDVDKYNFSHREWARAEYNKRKSEGICTRCGKRKADKGFYTCGICRSKNRNYKRIKYGKPDRKDRIENGLCYFCDNPVKEGYKVCEKHYQMNIEKSRSENANEARSNYKKMENRIINNRLKMNTSNNNKL